MKRSVCIDLDGVLSSYRGGWQGIQHFGDPIKGAKEFLESIAEFADIVIYTTRCCEELNGRNGLKANLLQKYVRDWLNKHDLPYHDIYIGQWKPICSCYIDDRAVFCDPENDTEAYAAAIHKARKFCKVEQDKGEKADVLAKQGA